MLSSYYASTTHSCALGYLTKFWKEYSPISNYKERPSQVTIQM